MLFILITKKRTITYTNSKMGNMEEVEAITKQSTKIATKKDRQIKQRDSN
jgi:hypothetical protein